MAIKLEKTGDSHKIDLTKSSSSQPLTVHVKLDWEELVSQPRGLFRKSSEKKNAPLLPTFGEGELEFGLPSPNTGRGGEAGDA